MGESLFYSWLRHVKECQIVQTNWKASSQWQLADMEEIERMMKMVDEHYSQKYGYGIFKQNTLMQLLRQSECDVLGISILPEGVKYYVVDVAFHEGGLNYSSNGRGMSGRDATIMKVLEKCARAAFCMQGYLASRTAEIIFAAPKINSSVLSRLGACVEEMNALFSDNGYNYTFRVIANDDYDSHVLQPILLVSDGVADTSELFLRSYQMYKMFSDGKPIRGRRAVPANVKNEIKNMVGKDSDIYAELRVGQLARQVLGPMLAEGCATAEEVEAMQTEGYSRQQFGIQYPLLRVVEEGEEKPERYYATPIMIRGKRYRLCSEWFEQSGNNDRPYLLRWIQTHQTNHA